MFSELPIRFSRNDTGLSIRLSTRDGLISDWYRLNIIDVANYSGQRSYNLPLTKSNFGIISNITIRFDRFELDVSTMLYYLCINDVTNTRMMNESWTGCAYLQPSIETSNVTDSEYSLRDADEKLV